VSSPQNYSVELVGHEKSSNASRKPEFTVQEEKVNFRGNVALHDGGTKYKDQREEREWRHLFLDKPTNLQQVRQENPKVVTGETPCPRIATYY
jgi:hypothetical protein